jgi:thiol-disulfide isomerase/thioredoxin
VLNVLASWCVLCHDEAPLLCSSLATPAPRLVGINYKDQRTMRDVASGVR